MKQYKGYYIDNVIFHNEKEIDAFVEKQAVVAFKNAVRFFCEQPTPGNSMYQDEKANILVNNFGYTWEQVEELEIQTLKEIA